MFYRLVLLLLLLGPAAVAQFSGTLNERQEAEQALVLLKYDRGFLPLQRLDTLKTAVYTPGQPLGNPFQEMAANYTQTTPFLQPFSAAAELGGLRYSHNLVLFCLMASTPADMAAANMILGPLAGNIKTVVFAFGPAASFKDMAWPDGLAGLYYSPDTSRLYQELAIQAVFGAIGTTGTLPEALPGHPAGSGLASVPLGRLKYTVPEEAGIDGAWLEAAVDAVCRKAIDSVMAAPGCQVVAAIDGKVVLHKTYGYHTFEKERPVKRHDIYDLASVTKISSSLPALIKFHGEGKLDLDATFGAYLPAFRKSNKGGLSIRDLLTHQARLQPFVPLWQATQRKNGNFKWGTFKNKPSGRFPKQVADSLFVHRRYHKKIYKTIRRSSLRPEGGYVYSDLFFYLSPLLVERLAKQPYEAYLKQHFYHPLGAYTLTYNPLRHFPESQIVPTEYDSLFRRQLVHGHVHDEGAAMLGGVSGHAGLFGSANDLLKLMQMYMDMGAYGGEGLLPKESVELFTSYQFSESNHRGLGFDKPPFKEREKGYVAVSASESSFGHSGFTGTFTWADPEHRLVVVFLSNRVHPTRNNRRLYQHNIRPALHQVFYDALIKAKS